MIVLHYTLYAAPLCHCALLCFAPFTVALEFLLALSLDVAAIFTSG